MNSTEPAHILLASHKSPCGCTWLLNALLAIGIHVFRSSSPEKQTFVPNADGSHSLNPAEIELKTHFPILSEKKDFFFDENLLIEWTHEFPYERNILPSKSFIFVRDPRDSLYSYYKRRNALVDFETFLEGVDYRNGLSHIDSYANFVQSWLSVPDIKIFRFEDFKLNPIETLQKFLLHLGTRERSEAELLVGIQSSSIENAKKSERDFPNPEFQAWGKLNRAGTVNEWKNNSSAGKGYLKIEQKIGNLMIQLGYMPNYIENNIIQPETTQPYAECVDSSKQEVKDNKLSILHEMLLTNNFGHYQNFELDLIRKLINDLSTAPPDSIRRRLLP